MVDLETRDERCSLLLWRSPSALERELQGSLQTESLIDSHSYSLAHYQAAQTIFQGPLSFTVRTPIQAGHRLLYARTTTSSFGTILDAEGFWGLFRAGDDRLPNDPLLLQQKGREEQRIKPAVYTYVIGEDDVFRFSETGASFFVDFASKHALHR